LFQDWPLLKD